MTGPAHRLEINDRVTDMIGRDGTVAAIDESGPLRMVTVHFDQGGSETMAEGLLEKRPNWGSMGRCA